MLCTIHGCQNRHCYLRGENCFDVGPLFINALICKPCFEQVELGRLWSTDVHAPPPEQHLVEPRPAHGRLPLLSDGTMHPLGHISFHLPHRLHYSRGVAICAACGAFTSGSLPKSITAYCWGKPRSLAGTSQKLLLCMQTALFGTLAVATRSWPLPGDAPHASRHSLLVALGDNHLQAPIGRPLDW